MNFNLIREVESLYSATQDFLSDDWLEEKQKSSDSCRTQGRNPFPNNPERYLKKDELLSMFKALRFKFKYSLFYERVSEMESQKLKQNPRGGNYHEIQ